jgi:hypothetical protein
MPLTPAFVGLKDNLVISFSFSFSNFLLKIMEQDQVVDRVQKFCNLRKIPTDNVLVITIQRNRTGDFCALVVDFSTRTLCKGYPDEMPTTKTLKSIGENFTTCYVASLPVEPVNRMATPATDTVGDESTSIFCCSKIKPYKPTRLDQNYKFDNFMKGTGSCPDDVFKVITKVSFGPTVSTKFYELNEGQRTLVEGDFTESRVAYRNYVCDSHKRFYEINLFARGHPGDRLNHRIRLVPTEMRNEALLEEFFAEVGV